ncbi:MAG TPA: YlxR family protein [Gaiellaceae bacterium]|nr:YlxR family protein [Gaiellaceae bacterium]
MSPVRTCAGCGRRAEQAELVRFGALEGDLVLGRTVPGRGAYTCTNIACFERAVRQKSFARVLRQPVRVDPTLGRLYTEELHD